MEKHAHQARSRFYVVMEGKGRVRVGDKQGEAKAGLVIYVPVGYSHRLVNSGNERMVLLVGINPTRVD